MRHGDHEAITTLISARRIWSPPNLVFVSTNSEMLQPVSRNLKLQNPEGQVLTRIYGSSVLNSRKMVFLEQQFNNGEICDMIRKIKKRGQF